MVDENKVEFTVAFHECLLALKDAVVNDDPMTEAGVLMDLVGDGRHVLIGFDGVDDSGGVGSHEEGGEADEASEFKYGLRLSLGEGVNQDRSLILPHIYHGMVSAEAINGVEDGERISFRR